jgi:Chemotaxis response regulator containing a CheY-like receiver domain and a methylesterase domain
MDRPTVFVVGGSAGSIEALLKILPVLPADLPVPILVVVHIPPDRDSGLAGLFQEKCALSVREARDKEPLGAGTVFFAPPDYHLQVEEDGYISLSCDEPRLFSRPSIDVLFESAADAFGDRVTGIILSGANHDGAQGLRAILAGGGHGLVQSPADARTPVMPLAALAICPTAEVRGADEIAEQLKARCGNGN